MSDPSVVHLECPGCAARYKARSAPPAGKALPCKKCGQPLRVALSENLLPDPSDRRPWSIPVRLGSYVVEGEIARGGMGVVYKARQEGLDRPVAVKMMLPGPASSEESVKRFHREARSAAKLRHPNIVSVHEIGDYQGMPFFSMDYVKGETLDYLLAKGPVPPERAAELLRETARAVEYAHRQGIVHRDLKPSNILIDEMGVPRITDFGLSKDFDSRSMLSVTGEVMGTPSYMSPEQAEGRVHEVDAASDVYSLGAVLYRILTGRAPFDGPTVAVTIYKVVHEYTTDPHKLDARIPPDLSAICMKALEKDRKQRYATAAEFAEDLDRFLRGEPVRAKATPPWRRWMRRISKNRTAFRVSAASVAVAVVAVVLLLVLGGGSYLGLIERNLASEDPAVRQQALSVLMEDLAGTRFSSSEREEAVALAERVLRQETDPERRVLFLSAMERKPVVELLPVVVAHLEFADPRELRVRAILILAIQKHKPAFDRVRSLLREADHDVHHAAVKYFLAVPDLRAFDDLGRLVADPRCGPEARMAISNLYNNGLMTFLSPSLGQAGQAVGALGEAVEGYNRRFEEVERELTGRSAPKDAVELSIARLSSTDAKARLRAAVELGMQKDARAAAPLLKACDDADDNVARAAGVALQECGAAKHREELTVLLDRDRAAVRAAAATALSSVREPAAENALAARLSREKDEEVREILKQALK